MAYSVDDSADLESGTSNDESEECLAVQASPPAPHILETLTAGAETVAVTWDGTSDLSGGAQTRIMTPRAYQLEMLAESMRRNVIVAMDTGTGKTQVAVMRIERELRRAAAEKIVWFLAPKVALCVQQFQVIKSQIPSIQVKLLTGDDNVDSWSDQRIWDAFLFNVRVVVSTPQILLDALSHAFVPLGSLALLVFDEAHNCIGKDPGSKIMMGFYHPGKQSGSPVPHILGLTASPIISSKLEGMERLEETLDAIIKSPNVHRDELLAAVKRPKLIHVTFQPVDLPVMTPSMQSLQSAYRQMDISKDPYVLSLQHVGTDRSRSQLEAVLKKYDTKSQNQMKSLCRTSWEVSRELGTWAAEYYVAEVIRRTQQSLDSVELQYDKWLDAEKQYMKEILSQVATSHPADNGLDASNTSAKFRILVEQLLSEDRENSGIVFVRERTAVVILAHMLPLIPRIRTKYRIGMATAVGKRDLWDLSKSIDLAALDDFRSGKINLLVATNVLEEGIDIQACNMVICFDAPVNLKSFIQRRGRARMRDSRLVILVEESERSPAQWRALEEEMKKRYEAEDRELKRLKEMEESDTAETESFVVENTGARLDYDNAKQHLEHFCRILSPGEYVDSRPDFIINMIEGSPPSIRATVLLPTYLPADVRVAKGRYEWRSEKNATKDAAFQAYVALFKAGLVNNNLLPFRVEDFFPDVEIQEGEVSVKERLDPWPRVALAWERGDRLWSYSLVLKDQVGALQGQYEMVLPIQLPPMRPVTAYVDQQTTWTIEFGEGLTVEDNARDDTGVLLALHFNHRWPLRNQRQVAKFLVKDAKMSMADVGSSPIDLTKITDNFQFLIRDRSKSPYVYDGLLPAKPSADSVRRTFYGFEDAPSDVPYLILKKWTRRADFLHPLNEGTGNPPSQNPIERVYPAPWAKVDKIPIKYARFGMLIPSILHEVELYLVTLALGSTVLSPIGLTDVDGLLTAISARSSLEPTDYERLEFLGDSLLKFCATVNAAAQHTDWPEGYLSMLKDRLVSNSRLARASVDEGLDRFMLIKPFTGKKWQPLYVDEVITKKDQPDETRKVSSKTLADVVEALMGASFKQGGIDMAIACISLFIKEITWMTPDAGRLKLYEMASSDVLLPPPLAPLEELIGHTFSKKVLLVVAMTHASYSDGDRAGCLERLEFIGDAVLEHIIVSKLFEVQPPLPHYNMHLLKTALVNHDILAFLCMEHRIEQESINISKDLKLIRSQFSLPLWRFMIHNMSAIGIEQAATEKRHGEIRGAVMDALERGSHYPWALLARLQAKKFFSDMFESLLAAVWVDSGSLVACERVLERFGILPYMRRILADLVHVLHPKEELGQLAVARTVNYVVDVREGPGGEREYLCKVVIGEECVAEVGGGVSREEVKTRAAEEAVRLMKAGSHGSMIG